MAIDWRRLLVLSNISIPQEARRNKNVGHIIWFQPQEARRNKNVGHIIWFYQP